MTTPLIDNSAPYLELVRSLDKAAEECVAAESNFEAAENRSALAEGRLSDARIAMEAKALLLVSGRNSVRVFTIPGKPGRVLTIRYTGSHCECRVVPLEHDFEGTLAVAGGDVAEAVAMVIRSPDGTPPDPYALAIAERLGYVSSGERTVPGSPPFRFWTATPIGIEAVKRAGIS